MEGQIEVEGWRRSNGYFGIRNHIAVLSSVACANHAVLEIVKRTDAVPITHNQGACGLFGADREQLIRTLVGMGSHPNVAWTLVVGLGCEGIDSHRLADEISEKGREAKSLLIQEEGMEGTIEEGVELIREMEKSLPNQKEKSSIEELTIGIKCGGSDYSSGMVSNPAVGKAIDLLIENGATAVFGERLEVVGAEDILANRAKDEEVREDFLGRIRKAVEDVNKLGVDWAGSQPSYGNIEGGITTIEEKSLGAVRKTGQSELKGCVDYASWPGGKGLFFMDTPGFDVECVSGLVAGGCHLILFTTGLGTYLGSPIDPVIKICANLETCKNLKSAIDVDLSSIMRKGEIGRGGKKILEEVAEVTRGKKTAAEKSSHTEFSIERTGPRP